MVKKRKWPTVPQNLAELENVVAKASTAALNKLGIGVNMLGN